MGRESIQTNQRRFERGISIGSEGSADPLSPALSVRYLTMCDHAQAARDSWLTSSLPDTQVFAFDEDNTFPVSKAMSDFDVLAIGGNDSARMANYVSTNGPLLRSAIKIAIINQASVTKRSQLLNAGFDDVFDPEKHTANEMKARILAHQARYDLAKAAGSHRHLTGKSIDQIAFSARLTPREKVILLAILSQSEGCAIIDISTALRDAGHAGDTNVLRAMISILRKKLKPGFDIKAVYGNGYRLEVS